MDLSIRDFVITVKVCQGSDMGRVLWDSYAFDDTGAHYVSKFGRQCFANTEVLDTTLHRLFKGGELQ